MPYVGTIIEESLSDTSVLEQLRITSTRVEPVTERHQTPWVKQWTLHEVEIPDDKAEKVAEQLSRVLGPQSWYADFRDDTHHYIVFPDKVFKVERKDPAQYEQAVAYGLGLGIPDYQLDFSWAVE
jgi:hypothetical protein